MKLIRFVVLLVLIGAAALYANATVFRQERPVTTTPIRQPATETPPAVKPDVLSVTKGYRDFNATGFSALFNDGDFPGTKLQSSPPPITGAAGADRRIRKIAEGRGYRLRPIANAAMSSADGHSLQKKVAAAYGKLKAAATKAGHDLHVVSGFRSVADQRTIFLAELHSYGFTNRQIADGDADKALNEIMKEISVPGYSRHHSGYAIDLADGIYGLNEFAGTGGERWLRADNYYNAKRFGFIPSYPPGLTKQGPEPEPWEYVFVGTEVLKAD